MNQIRTQCNGDTGKATVITSDGIKVFSYEDIMVSDLVAMDGSHSAPASYKSFAAFHNANPEILPLLIKMAKELKGRGVLKYSLRGLFHVIRYDYRLKAKDNSSDFGLNNNYSSYYSRLIMTLEPSLKGFFDLRAQNRNQS